MKNEKTLYFCLIVLLLFVTSQGCDCGGEVIPKEGDVFTQGDVFTRDVITDISGVDTGKDVISDVVDDIISDTFMDATTEDIAEDVVDTYRDAVEVIDVSDVMEGMMFLMYQGIPAIVELILEGM
ncbi:MAG: hypothetical protein ACP5KG_06305 [Myxococcota bacterium]